jgi:evolved beta-galactosidase subunit beta
MQRFSDLDQMLVSLGEATKWRRVAEAVQRADRVLPDVTYSIGDSLTYRVTSQPDCVALTGHRRYLEARYVLDGALVIEVAPAPGVQPADGYDDLTDRQHFDGTGERHRLVTGGIAIVNVDEAIRDVEVDGVIMVFRVTVER